MNEQRHETNFYELMAHAMEAGQMETYDDFIAYARTEFPKLVESGRAQPLDEFATFLISEDT